MVDAVHHRRDRLVNHVLCVVVVGGWVFSLFYAKCGV